MATRATSGYRFGDLLALARLDWIRQMTTNLADLGYADYRATDAASMRRLLAGPVALGELGRGLGATRQAARKAVRGLEERGYVATRTDAVDARKTNVELTASGRRYALDIVKVIDRLNTALAARVDVDRLVAADIVLRALITDEGLRRHADRVPPPA